MSGHRMRNEVDKDKIEAAMKLPSVDIKDYQYTLPDHKIARFPERDRSAVRLLHYNRGHIQHRTFKEFPDLIPTDAFVVFNDTKVIPARIIFHRSTGAQIEIFLLAPAEPENYEENLSSSANCSWHCLIGNAKKWKEPLLELKEFGLSAKRLSDDKVLFEWHSGESFAELLNKIGKLPLPPYIDRALTPADYETYQTVYSKAAGAVAAPTAGLHFTKEILDRLTKNGIASGHVTLHVSAGTFQPMKAKNPEDHPMHREHVIIRRHFVEQLLSHNKVVAVGTTSMRTLESLYWYGVKLLEKPDAPFFIEKLAPYNIRHSLPTRNEALQAVLQRIPTSGVLTGQTEIFLFPGVTFHICSGLVTNFHLPGSTLMLLVGAFVGQGWKKIYQEALDLDYRFLSYGDASLLWPS